MILPPARFPWGLAVACAALLALVAWSFSLGQVAVSGADAWRALWSAMNPS